MEELIPIYREIIEVKQGEENLPIILVGNKCDEDNQREVSLEYSNEMVAKILKGCGFIETSAKTSHNVHEAFQVKLFPISLLQTLKTKQKVLSIQERHTWQYFSKSIFILKKTQELLSMDKTRNMSLKMDLKKSRSQIRKEKLKGHCSVM